MASKKKRSKRPKKDHVKKGKSKKTKVKKKSGSCCSYSSQKSKKHHSEKMKTATRPVPKLQSAVQPQPQSVVVSVPAILVSTTQPQTTQEPKAKAGDIQKSISSTEKTPTTSITTTEVSTPTTTNTNTTKDNDEVDVETEGNIKQPKQSLVIRKYMHEGRTVRYFDHKMSYPAEDRPESFFPPMLRKFIAYQRCMKGVPLKKQKEEKKLVSKGEVKQKTGLEDLETAMKVLQALIEQIKGRVEKLIPEMRRCADDMESGADQMGQLIGKMSVSNQANRKH